MSEATPPSKDSPQETPERSHSALIFAGTFIATAVVGAALFALSHRSSTKDNRLADTRSREQQLLERVEQLERQVAERRSEPKFTPEPAGRPEQFSAPRLSGELSGDAIFRKAKPAVVMVDVERGHGSGFFVQRDLVVTNHHVVRDARSVKVLLSTGRTIHVRGATAVNETTDLVLLKLENEVAVEPLTLGEKPPVGARVYALGHPAVRAATMPFTFTDGIVSAHRPPSATRLCSQIQVTAPVHFGSSGGPLLDSTGTVIGVVVGGHPGTQFNFAIDASHVSDLMSEGKAGELVRLPIRGSSSSNPEREHALHFVKSLQASESAWELVKRPFDRIAPEELMPASRTEFARRMGIAYKEATQVPMDALQRYHPELPDAFKDYLAVTGAIGPDVIRGVRDQEKATRWNRWVAWMNAHAREIRLPSR